MKKILIWGTGYYEQHLEVHFEAEIMGYIETQKRKTKYKELPVFDFKDMPLDYDYIICAFVDVDNAFITAYENGIDLRKVVFLEPGKQYRYFNSSEELKQIIGKDYEKYAIKYNVPAGTFFYKDLDEYKRLNNDKTFEIEEANLYPIVNDKFALAGHIDPYFWQDTWAARKIISKNIKDHWDIGSRVDGYISILVSAGVRVNVIDVRPFNTKIDGLNFTVDDATFMNNISDETIDSVSALCSLEHFGLGRYGDPVRPDAWKLFIENLQKKVRTGGNIYISVPVSGRQRLEFNAHRVFAPETIVDRFDNSKLKEFSIVLPDSSGIVNKTDSIGKSKLSYDYVYGLFWFEKLAKK